jgi:hypothetical protein
MFVFVRGLGFRLYIVDACGPCVLQRLKYNASFIAAGCDAPTKESAQVSSSSSSSSTASMLSLAGFCAMRACAFGAVCDCGVAVLVEDSCCCTCERPVQVMVTAMVVVVVVLCNHADNNRNIPPTLQKTRANTPP